MNLFVITQPTLYPFLVFHGFACSRYPQCTAQQGSGAELLKLRFLELAGATTYVIIDGGCANPQSPHFERWAA